MPFGGRQGFSTALPPTALPFLDLHCLVFHCLSLPFLDLPLPSFDLPLHIFTAFPLPFLHYAGRRTALQSTQCSGGAVGRVSGALTGRVLCHRQRRDPAGGLCGGRHGGCHGGERNNAMWRWQRGMFVKAQRKAVKHQRKALKGKGTDQLEEPPELKLTGDTLAGVKHHVREEEEVLAGSSTAAKGGERRCERQCERR